MGVLSEDETSRGCHLRTIFQHNHFEDDVGTLTIESVTNYGLFKHLPKSSHLIKVTHKGSPMAKTELEIYSRL